MYSTIVTTIRPQKAEPYRSHLTIGGDCLDYPFSTMTRTASLTTIECILSSTISTADAKFMAMDVNNFYYDTPMSQYEYMRLHLSILPQESIDHYNLLDLATGRWVYLEIRKHMPGLKQAGLLANQCLTRHFAKYGHAHMARTPALTRPILPRFENTTLTSSPFCLSLTTLVSSMLAVGRHHANHLVQAVKDLYSISLDWTGSLYCGLTLKWDYFGRTVDVSMPNYIANALHKFQHNRPHKSQDAPNAWVHPVYGAPVQYAPLETNLELLSPKQVNLTQQIVGTLLFYAVAVDNTMVVALDEISSEQSKATSSTWTKVQWLLHYAATHPNATVRFKASNMVLHVHLETSCFPVSRARSRAGGRFFLSSTPAHSSLLLSPAQPAHNGPIHTVCKILKNVMSLAAEAKIGAAYINAQDAIPIRTTLIELGHPEPPTPIQLDNSTTSGFANNTIKQKWSKAIDMEYYWLQYHVAQQQFLIYWRPGHDNPGKYHTKHHSPSYHHL